MTQNDILERTKAAAHFVIAHTTPERLGATKLNKVLWFADIEAYKRLGKTITGEISYQKKDHGPVPNTINEAIETLKAEGAIAERLSRVHNFSRREFVWLEEPNIAHLNGQECQILLDVAEELSAMTAQEVSALSHDVLYEETCMGQQIDIGAASVTFRDPTPQELAWAEEELHKIAAE